MANPNYYVPLLRWRAGEYRALKRLRKNPLGIFVNAINWSKELGS